MHDSTISIPTVDYTDRDKVSKSVQANSDIDKMKKESNQSGVVFFPQQIISQVDFSDLVDDWEYWV